ncbi:phosphoglycerate mutase-like protein [Leucogyrophana mollusca]|uniref:Phosphoglycerate mutase-like protein n=1 Tax=Leucogyrophana mollusca TaxID=85980 RepID=A0ACB8B7R9_9AGAM|nr:phosphoglycerate mutase-like protein [Leucogyrophana mollusca]
MVNTTSAAGLLGVVLLARHGDRLGYYQDPTTYNSNQSYITPLGSVQEHQLGSFLRETYLNPSSPSYIEGINTDVVDVDQLFVRADSGGGNVVLDSAYGLLQGLYPPTRSSAITLANGSTVTGPLGGYQYVPVDSVEMTQIPSLTSWMDCNYFIFHLNRVYQSASYLQMAETAGPFLNAVTPYLGSGISNNFTNMWNIYDYINVQSIHNKTFYEALPPTFLEQARYYANFVQQAVFSDSVSNSVGNIGIRTLLPEIMWSLGNMTEGSNKVKLALTQVDYKPFIGLFNVTNATLTDPDISGIANYASVVALELSQDAAGEASVSMKFKNGTDDKEFRQLALFGNTSIPLNTFVKNLAWITINSTNEWCFSCNQTTLRGCSVYNFSNDPFINGVTR